MTTETIDQPAQQVQSTPVQQSGDLKGMLEAAATGGNSDPNFKAAPSNPDQVVEQPQSTEQKPAEKAKPKSVQKPAQTGQKPEKGKDKWQRLDALESPENANETASSEQPEAGKTEGEVQATEGQQDEQPLTRWKELRATEDKYKEIAPAYERLQKEIEELKSKPQIPEEVTKELENLRQMYAVELLDTKPDFQAEVLAPKQEQLNNLKSVADHAKLDANQRQALRAAVENPDSFSRIRAIKQILGASEAIEDPEDLATLVQFALEAGGKYQEALKKEYAYVNKASELAQSVRGKEAQVSLQEKKAKEQAYETAHKEMIVTLKAPLQALFDDDEFGPQLTESLDSIRPAESPMDQAYQAQAGEILPFTVKMINKLKGEVASLKKSLQARESAKPRTTDGTTPQAEQGGNGNQPDLKFLLNNAVR